MSQHSHYQIVKTIKIDIYLHDIIYESLKMCMILEHFPMKCFTLYSILPPHMKRMKCWVDWSDISKSADDFVASINLFFLHRSISRDKLHMSQSCSQVSRCTQLALTPPNGPQSSSRWPSSFLLGERDADLLRDRLLLGLLLLLLLLDLLYDLLLERLLLRLDLDLDRRLDLERDLDLDL